MQELLLTSAHVAPPPGTNIPTPASASAAPVNLANQDRTKLSRKDGDANPRDSKDYRPSAPPLTSPSQPTSAVDPISHHIFARTATDRSIASRLLNSARPDSPANDTLPRPSADLPNKLSTSAPDSGKDKKKGVSFLSRLSMIGGRKKDSDSTADEESEFSEQRTEGANAVAFSSAVYIPHHKEPPRYIRVRSHHKKTKEFDHVFLAQELTATHPVTNGHTNNSVSEETASQEPGNDHAIWTVEFSQDGRFLATGGRDNVVRIFAVIATDEDRKPYEDDEQNPSGREERLSAPVFHSKPIREFVGHSGDILDLSWSKNGFLLSSSMDKTVRLWHTSRQECLCTFEHKDFVASIAFHPRDDRFFLAGSLDSVLRLWSIPDKAVAYTSQLSDIITAVGFSPDGKTAIAGCFNGICMFYETEGLQYLTQIHVRSSRGKNAKGSKITGIQTMHYPPGNEDGEVKVLITSNDSRIRIYNLRDKTLELKLKGHENTSSQIKASFSDDGSYVICGSEDRRAFIWSKDMAESEMRDKGPREYFEAHADIVTTTVFAPTKTRQLLQASGDPIFTLCNPPPVTLRSREESTTNLASSTFDTQSVNSFKSRKPEESPAFIARSSHYDGNIIVTADRTGLIKVFRQDCAFTKRRNENWETGSLSRRLGRDSLLGRTGSIMTRTSAASSRDPHSRRGSLTQPIQINSDRINTWRQGVEGNPGRPLSIATSLAPARSERSMSPTKANRQASSSLANAASEARRQQYSGTSPRVQPTSPAGSIRSGRTNEYGNPVPPTPSFSFQSLDDDTNDLRLDAAGGSYSFWNLNKWRSFQTRTGGQGGDGAGSRHERSGSSTLDPESAANSKTHRRRSFGFGPVDSGANDKNRRKSMPLRPAPLEERDETEGSYLSPPERTVTHRTASTLSALSSGLGTQPSEGGDGEDLRCSKCGNRDFRAKKVIGVQRLLCKKCGTMIRE
ncbi:WD40-repeat-containing domain protein [Xylariaceae sp. FL1019]|nr:WD40-repeat-containing domain protein [Xylariaceae sp. FL1019]